MSWQGVFMRPPLIVAFVLMASLAARDASAQSAAPPVELGLDVSTTLVQDRPGLLWGPRLAINFDGHNSMLFTASLQKLAPEGNFADVETDLYLVAYRRLVHATGPIRVSAMLGGGLERTVIVSRAVTFGDPPVTFPSTRGVEVLPAFTTGAAVDFRLGRRASIVLESSFVLSDTLDGRLSAGLVVPIGSYPGGTGRLASSVPWARLDPGERAWITTGDGRELDGEVVDRSEARLTLRTRTGTSTFAVDDVRAIDTTDPIRNGTVIGAAIGAGGAVLPAVFATLIFCSEEDCGAGDVLWVNGVLIGMGAGIGAATGALADSLRVRRVPLFRRGSSASVSVAPIIGPHRLGGGAVIRW
jgi:hypothetical protein